MSSIQWILRRRTHRRSNATRSRETRWSSVGAETPLWSARVGLGYSNVSIAGGRLYTLGHDPEALRDNVVCLDAATGEELWRHEYEAQTMANFHGGGSLTTPTVDGDVVFVCGRRGRAFALDAKTGAVRWERDYKAELELEDTEYGFSASPLALDDKLVLVFGGMVVFLDKTNGAEAYGGFRRRRVRDAAPVPSR